MQDLNQLRVFVEVVRAGSFSEAARRLNQSTGAVSRSIARLEADLDARLLMRTTRSISLTDAGRSYYENVEAALSRLDQARDAFVTHEHQIAGTVRVTMPSQWARTNVLPDLPAFLDRYPKIHLEVACHDTLPDLVAGGFDVGVQYSGPINSSYIARCIQHLRVFLVASPDYVRRRGVPVTPIDLLNHDCVNIQLSSAPVSWRLIADSPGVELEKHVHVPRGRIFLLNNSDAVVDAVLAGLGITALDVTQLLPLVRAGRLRILLPEYRVVGTEAEPASIHMLYPHRHHVPLRVRLFMDFLVQIGKSDVAVDFNPHEFAH